MRQTAERHSPDVIHSSEDVAMDVRHRYAYSLVEAFAKPHHHLLDVGAGEGYGALIVADWVADYRGVDVSAEAMSAAARRYGGSKIQFDHYAGESLPYSDSSFDLITSFQVIEHVASVEIYLRELRRVARSDGHILITTPNRRLRLREGERPWNRYHLREYDDASLRLTVQEVFPDVELFGVRGSRTMEEQERARIARARRLARWDRFGVRYMLPESVDAALRGFLRGRRGRLGAWSSSPSLADMWHTKDDLDQALDLLVIARRES
jgi:ubiquinone/menaquinone biosynthesis C-methylase UbiE